MEDEKEIRDIEERIATIEELDPRFDEASLAVSRDLSNRKKILLGRQESSWRLKSRVLWLAKGDGNTKFFQNYATMRRNKNCIWEIKKDDGAFCSDLAFIQDAAEDHFRDAFKQNPAFNLVEQLRLSESFLAFVLPKRE